MTSIDLPTVLRTIRSNLDLTQAELAETLGVSFATVNRWEGGGNKPQKAPMERILELAAESGIDVADIGGAAAPAPTRRRGRSRAAATPSTKSMEQMLWDAASSIRGEKDAPKFKDYLLPLLFLKRLSDVFDDEIVRLAEEFGDQGVALEIAESDHSLLRFYLPPEARWSVISGRTTYDWPSDERGRSTAPRDIGEHLTRAVRAVVRHNPNLSGVIDVVDFATERNGERDINPAKLRGVVETFSDPRYRLGLADVQPDFLGRAYEYLLRKFAEGSGQSAGEFFTPTEVGFLMAKILRPRPGETCYDYACGSGGLLIKLQLVARELDPTSKVPLKMYGQELQAESYAVARMNTIIHDMDVDLQRGDTIINPKFRDAAGSLMRFDVAVANPMWNQPFDPDLFVDDPFDRFMKAGGATTGRGDWAWLQHTIASMNDGGRAAVVLDTGATTRGSGSKNEDKERNIRRWFVEHDLIEGVVLLPDNLFYNTPAAGLIVVLNKRKPASRKDKIVLVNASRRFTKGKPKNHIAAADIDAIAKLFLAGEGVEGEVAVLETADVAAADYNLNPSRWISHSTAEASIPIPTLIRQARRLSDEERAIDERLFAVLAPAADQGGQGEQDGHTDLFAGPASPAADSPTAGWSEGVLGDYIERPDYGFTDSASDDPSGTKFLRITDIQNGQVDWSTVPYCQCPPDVVATKRLLPGDVVVARIGATTGKSFYIDEAPDEAVFASYLIRLRAHAEVLLPRYLYYYMQTEAYWAHVDSHKGDRLKGGVNINVLESLPVLIPPVDEQARIVQMLDLLQAATRVRKREVLEVLLDSLLDHLLAGRLTADDFNLSALPQAAPIEAQRAVQ